MSSKSTSSAAAETLREAAAATTAAAPEMSRHQFARSADWMATAFRTAGALQQVNSQMAQRAALLHAQAADNARKAGSPMELVQIQSSLLLYQWQEMNRYSQEWLLACSRVMGQSPASAGESGSTANGHAGNGFTDAAAPMVQAWQQMFSGLVSETANAKH